MSSYVHVDNNISKYLVFIRIFQNYLAFIPTKKYINYFSATTLIKL